MSPSLDVVVEAAHVPPQYSVIDRRVLQLGGVAVVLGVLAPFVAQALLILIALITNVAFFGSFSLEHSTPAAAVPRLGWWVVPIPVVGAIIVGLIARYGSKAIRGHGIPEAMEQILTNQSRIPARITFLKPVSSAVSIGTGGPFGAEGPIIATGGALGSLLGQLIKTTAAERKTLLAAGAAAGMAATFGSPVSAVLLAIELLLFECLPRSIIPVALAAATAAGLRMGFEGAEPVFAMSDLQQPTLPALAAYIALGGVQPFGLLPLLGSCAAAYLVSSLLMRNSIMTEKISRRGIRTPEEYLADPLEQLLVRDVAAKEVISLNSQHTVQQVQQWLAANAGENSHQGYPVLDDAGVLVGVLTRGDLLQTELPKAQVLADVIWWPPKYVYDDCTVRQAADHMVNHNIGRLPVVAREAPHPLTGIVTRSDILSGFRRRLRETSMQEPSIQLFKGRNGLQSAKDRQA